jgi:hypothetical protein
VKIKTEIRGLTEFKARMNDLAKKQIPYALARALNDTAYGAMQTERKEIADSFDRPTPFVQKGVFYEKASASKLVAFTRIAGERDKFNVARVLAPHVYGGGRVVKASERRMRRTGAMGAGQWIVPGAGAPKDKYGNISGGQMQRILGFVRQYQEGGYNVTKQVGGHYVVPFVGVFKRTGRGKRSSIPVLHFTYAAPKYEAGRFEFHHAARLHFEKTFHGNMNSAWNYALTSSIARG